MRLIVGPGCRRRLSVPAAFLAGFTAIAEPAPPHDDAVKAQVGALSADSWQTRQTAFDRLCDWGNRHPEIARLLPGDDPDPEVRNLCDRLRHHMRMASLRLRSLALAPEDSGWTRVVDALFAGLGPGSLQAFARAARGRWPEPGGEVLGMFLDDPCTGFRKDAIRGFGILNRIEEGKRLVPVLEDSDPELRSAAVAVLISIARQGHDPTFRVFLVDRLQAVLEDPDWNVREIAANGIGALREPGK